MCVLVTFLHAFLPLSVELILEILLPSSEAKFAVDGRHDRLTVDHLAFQVRGGVVLDGAAGSILIE